ncbi:MAG: arylamine N-acetyltransferase family protein [Thermoanaerobaculia bacterium]
MNVDAYLERIRYHGPLEPTLDTLRRLHLAHLYAVPFENLSIHWGEPIQLDDEALFEKIVTRRRGGFCYELNGLFAALLRALGFDVAMLSAGVGRAAGEFSPDYDHMALLVTLEDRWLADVGFGDSFREPLRLDKRGEQPDGGLAYRLEETGDGRLLLARREEGGPWQPQYRFGLEPHLYADYAGRCHFHQTSPDSHFTQNLVCSLATPDGRVTLSGMKLITTRGGERRERELADEREYAEALRQIFGVVLAGS